MSETAEALPIGAVEGQPGVTVVDQHNFNDYVTQQLNPNPPQEEEGENESPEAIAAAEQAKIDADKRATEDLAAQPKEGDLDGNKVFFKGKWKDKSDFGYRLHLKGLETEKAAADKIAAAEAKAKAIEERAAKAEKEAAELKAKYEPPQSDDPTPEPQPGEFSDVAAYSKALKDWTAKETRREDAAKAKQVEATKAQESTLKRWNERMGDVAKEIPDYLEKINGSEVALSNQASQAVMKAKNGHEILYHFAKNPEEAVALGKLSVEDMLMEIGRLDGIVAKPKAETKTESKPEPKAELSRAPAPITPLRGANHGTGLKVDAAGNWIGTYEEFKAAVNAGKIQ